MMRYITGDCLHRGHIWLEADGSLMSRKKAKKAQKPETVEVHCQHCEATATLTGYGPQQP